MNEKELHESMHKLVQLLEVAGPQLGLVPLFVVFLGENDQVYSSMNPRLSAEDRKQILERSLKLYTDPKPATQVA